MWQDLRCSLLSLLPRVVRLRSLQIIATLREQLRHLQGLLRFFLLLGEAEELLLHCRLEIAQAWARGLLHVRVLHLQVVWRFLGGAARLARVLLIHRFLRGLLNSLEVVLVVAAAAALF